MNRFASLCSLPMLLVIAVSAAIASDDAGTKRSGAAANAPVDVGLDAALPLAGRDFSLRRRSTLELWQHRDRYREAVLAAARGEDLEAAERARWVLGRWQRGILASTPAELAQKLSELPPVEAIQWLLESGDFAAAAIAMQEAQGTLDFEVISARVSITLDQRFPIYARAAVIGEQTQAFGDFLDAASSTKEMAVCLHDWSRLFSLPENAEDSPRLPHSAQLWAPELVEQTQCLLHLIDGDVEAAMKVAVASDRELLKRETATDTSASDDGIPGLLSRKQQPLTRVARMVTSQWTALAGSASSSALAFERAAERLLAQREDQQGKQMRNASQLAMYRAEAIRHWSDALIAAERCGDQTIRSAAVTGLITHQAELDQADVKLPDLASIRDLVWRTLLIHGEFDAAMNVIAPQDPNTAATIASDASRSAEALRLLGFPADEIDTQLETWIDEAIIAQRELYKASNSEDPIELAEAAAASDTGLVAEVDNLFLLIRLLDAVDRDDAAWRIADRLSTQDLQAKQPRRSTSYLVRDYVLLALMYTTHSDWMFRLAMRPWESEPSSISQGLISRVMVSEDHQLLGILMQFVKLQRPQIRTNPAFRIACEIARADENDRRRHRELVASLSQSLRDGSLRRQVTPEAEFEGFFEPTTHVWGDLFAAHGRPDLAETFLRKRAASGDLKAALILAKEYRLGGSIPASDKLHEDIWAAVASSENDELSQFRDDVMTAVSAVGEQLRAARDGGDVRTAESLLMQLRAMACTPSTDMRQQIADVLAELGQWQVGNGIYRSLMMITAINSDETQSMIDIARNFRDFAEQATAANIEQTESAMQHSTIADLAPESRRLRSEANRWLDVAFAGTLDHVEFRAPLYLHYSQLIAREQIELAIMESVANRVAVVDATATRQASAATEQQIRRLLDRLHALDQMDITTAESILPKLTEVGLQKLAHQQMAKMMEAAEQHLRTFPADAATANNVAWGAAVNDFDLPTALRLSRHSVRFEPESAIYRDTLAEILARTGDAQQALAIEQGTLIDDPGQWHLHEQVERFKKILSNSH